MKGNAVPALQVDELYRPKEPIQLLENVDIKSTTPVISDPVQCAPFRKFGLFVYVDFTGTADTITLHIEVEFLDRWTGKWYTHKQGLFASLYYEDTDTATGIWECFQGECLGRQMRVKLTGAGVSTSNYFTVSIGVDLWN